MTAEQFVIWLRGFAQAANTYNITPKQWDTVCEQLGKVNQPNIYTMQIGTGGTGVVNTTADARNDVTYNNDVPTTKTLLTDNTVF